MALPYSLSEGLAGLRRAKFAAFASTSAMTVALVLIGLFGLVAFEAQEVSNWLRQRVGELRIYLTDEAGETVAEALRTRAAATPGVEEAEYISPAEAQVIFERDFGEGAEDFYETPFLPAEIKVRVASDYATPDSLTSLAEEFASWNRVDDVIFNQALLVKVQQNLRLISIVGLSLGTLVVLAALFLVANTIRLTVYARRLLIRTMKLVGATDAFIRRPFVVEGIVQGAVGGVGASLILWALYRFAAGQLPQLGAQTTLGGLALAGALIGVGVVLGWVGSYFAVRRFVRRVALH